VQVVPLHIINDWSLAHFALLAKVTHRTAISPAVPFSSSVLEWTYSRLIHVLIGSVEVRGAVRGACAV
jgi:hypothetical protein